MAKSSKKLEKIKSNTTSNNMKKTIDALLSNIDGILAQDAKTTEWVSTGIKSLNFLLSGDVNKGLPAGKMIVVAGKQQSGKSLLGGRAAAIAQKQGYIVVWLDTEFASEEPFFKRVGLDVEKTIYKEIADAEQLQVDVLKLLKMAKEKNLKLFIVLDSLGNLMGTKEAADADNDKLVADRGARAKSVRGALSHILAKLGQSNSILYAVNHMYVDSSNFMPKNEMRGGFAPYYLGQVILFLTRLKHVEGESVKIRIKSKKNREFIEGRLCEFIINYVKGIDENDGLFDLFAEFGLIKEAKGWYKIMIDGVGVYRNREDLQEAVNALVELKKKVSDIQLTSKTKDFNIELLSMTIIICQTNLCFELNSFSQTGFFQNSFQNYFSPIPLYFRITL